MSEPIAMLVGGTKVLERELQNHLTMPLVSVATIEEAAKVLGERATRLIVLGPTLRRALATVTTLRREGQSEPRLMVVYRDDQRDEVKRHQKGRQVADSYIAQSRIQREVGPALSVLLGQSGESALEEIPLEALSSEELSSEDLSSDDLSADELPPPVAGADPQSSADLRGQAGSSAVPAADAPAVTLEGDILEFLDEFPMEDEEILEELDDGDLRMEELPLEDLSLALEPVQASGEHDVLASDLLEDMGDGLEEVESLEGIEIEELTLEGGDQDGQESVEEVVGAELIEEVSASAERIEELESVELMEDLEEQPEELAATERELPAPAAEPVQAAAVEAVAAEVVAAEVVAAAADDASDTTLEQAAPVPLELAPVPPLAHAAPAHAAPAHSAAAPADAVQADAAPAQAAPVAGKISQRQPSGAQAMFSELTSFMERLQDAASANARLEAENEQLREALELAKRAGRPELEAEVSTLRQSVGDLQLRLTGAERARDAAVDARMRAEQSQGSHAEALTQLRAELAAANQELAGLRQELAARAQEDQRLRHEASAARSELAAAQNQLSNLESQLDARRRISADSAKSLRAIAMMLEE